MALDMEKFIAKGDRTLLWSSDAFGPLDSDNGDGSDADEWVDRVEDEELLRRLHLVEGHRQDGDEVAAWEELQRIPAQYEFHVEVLRRRLILCHYAGFADHDALTRWARALAAAEPYDAMNWASLEHAVAGADGERHQVAADVLREAIDRHGPDFVLYYSFASRLCSLGRIKEAQDAMRSALDEDPYAITSALDSTCFAPIWGFLSEVQDSRS
jgi:tetratricopeptide (TPR) repeat protein